MSVRWLGLSICLERVVLYFAALKLYFLSISDKDRSSSARVRQLIQVFENPITEFYCYFLHACLPAFVNFNLLLQREDPVIPFMYNVMIDLLSGLFNRVLLPEVVQQFRTQTQHSS